MGWRNGEAAGNASFSDKFLAVSSEVSCIYSTDKENFTGSVFLVVEQVKI